VKVRRSYCLLTLLFVVTSTAIFAGNKGSDSAISIESHAFFPAGEDNKMLSFGWFKNGFTLADFRTTCTFDSTFPVLDHMSLHGGTLVLDSDLMVNNISYLDTSGVIDGQGHLFDLSESITGIPAHNDTILKNLHLFLNADLHISGTVTFQGDCTLNGRKNRIVLDNDAHLIIDKNATVKLKNLELYGIKDGKVWCVDDSGVVQLDNMRWVQSADYTFTQGSISFLNDVTFAGPHLFHYDSSLTSTIHADARWYLLDIVTLMIGRKDGIYGREPLYFEDSNSSFIEMVNSTIQVTDSGMRLTRGNLIGGGDIKFSIDSTSSVNALIFGDGSAEGDFTVKLKPESSLTLKRGYVVYDIAAAENFLTDNVPVSFIQEADSTVLSKQHVNFKNIVAKKGLVNNFLMEGDKHLTFDHATFKLPVVDYIITATWINLTSNLLGGSGDNIFLLQGDYPLATFVENSNNSIAGTGDVTGPIIFQDGTSELSVDLHGKMLGTVTLNGSKLLLGHDLTVAKDTLSNCTGTIDVGNNALYFPIGEEVTLTSTVRWEGNGGLFCLSGDMKLAAEQTFAGDWIILGNGNVLDFAYSGSLVIAPYSNVYFKNIILKNISDYDLRCLDNSSNITFDCTSIILDNDYTFTVGTINFNNYVDVIGSSTFFYQSKFTSTINTNSIIHVNPEACFSIERNVNSGNEPLYFVDNSSTIKLDNSTLRVGSNGAQMTRGRVLLDKESSLDLNSTSTLNGLILGDGTSDGDIVIEWNAAALLNFPKGHVKYDVVSPKSFYSRTKNTQVNIGADFYLHLTNDTLIKNLTFASNSLWELVLDPGKILSYESYTIQFPGIEYEITGQRYDDVTALLNGNDEIIVRTGNLPMGVVVLGTGNVIHGPGGASAPIVLGNPSAQLILSIGSPVLADITLNGGTLILGKSLLLGENNTLIGSGTLVASNKTIELVGSDLHWTGTTVLSGDDSTLALKSDMKLSGNLIIDGNWTIQGNGNTLDFIQTSSIIVNTDSSITFKNILLDGLRGDKIKCVDDTGEIVFHNAVVVLDDDFTMEKGKFLIEHQVDFVGNCKLSYESSMTSTVSRDSCLHICEGMEFSLGRKYPYGRQPIYFEDLTSEILMDNSTMTITSSGMSIINGSLNVTGNVTVSIDSTNTWNGLILGDGTVDNDMQIKWLPAALVNISKGHLTYNVSNPNGLKSDTNSATLQVGPQFILNMEQDMHLKDLHIKTSIGWQLIKPVDKTLSYENYKVDFPGILYQISGSFYNDISNLLAGDDEIIVIEGVLPLVTYVAGTGNTIHGQGHVGAPIVITDPSAELTLSIFGRVFADITMLGGTLNIGRMFGLGNGNTIVGAGTVNLNDKLMVLIGTDYVWTSTLTWEATHGVMLSLNATNVYLNGTWNIDGDCIYDGGGGLLDLGATGQINIMDNSSFTFKNVSIRGISNEKIKCLTGSGRLILDDVSVIQDDDYSFVDGSLTFQNNVNLCGGRTFNYDSRLTCTIRDHSTLHVLDETTLRIGREHAHGREPLYFGDRSAQLILDNATLAVTSSGARLTRGSLIIDHDGILELNSTDTNTGIIFGNGVEADDMVIRWNAGSTMEFERGHLTYENTTNNGFDAKTRNTRAKLGTDVSLNIHNDIHLKNLSIESIPGWELLIAENKNLTYENYVAIFPGIEYEITGRRFNSISNYLDGDSEIIITTGATPLITVVGGSNNKIHGLGGIGALVLLLDGSSELTLDILSDVFADISLGGGKVILQRPLVFGHDKAFLESGTVALSNEFVEFGGTDLQITSTVYWDGTRGVVKLRSPISMTSQWTFSGDCILDGVGNELDLLGIGQLQVERGSTLTIRNMRLSGICAERLLCKDNASHIIFDDVKWIQDDHMTFSVGSFEVKNELSMCGAFTFTYASPIQSIINRRSTLILDKNYTLAYDSPTTDRNLIQLYDRTAKLLMNGATLSSTSTGLELTKGILEIRGNCFFASDATSEPEGITLGDGQNADNDLIIDILPKSRLNLTSGYLVYKDFSYSE